MAGKRKKGSEREDADEGTRRKNRKGRTGAGWEREKCKPVIYNGRTTRDGNYERLRAKKQ